MKNCNYISFKENAILFWFMLEIGLHVNRTVTAVCKTEYNHPKQNVFKLVDALGAPGVRYS